MKFAVPEICNAASTMHFLRTSRGSHVTSVRSDLPFTPRMECYTCGKPAGAMRRASERALSAIRTTQLDL